ncbi:MAG: hypothetical protein Q4F27_01330 [Desulfovibrionaceae bacterium]|nr:hypothetical protein [Desulfovibrionaceae bacterium]
MKKPQFSVPWLYGFIWLGLVGCIFAYSMAGNWGYLLLPTQAPQETIKTPAASPAPGVSTHSLSALLPPQAPLNTQPLPPDTVKPVHSGKPLVSSPQFDTSGPNFTASFDLGIAADKSHASWQATPAAWMVDVPGQWQRQGREEYQIQHGLIRKARIMLYKDKVRFKFYFNDRKQKRGPLPLVDLTERGISITITKQQHN